MHTGRTLPAHVSVWSACYRCGGARTTSQTRIFWAVPRSQHSSGRVSPEGPTAFNQLGHEALQMGLSRRVGPPPTCWRGRGGDLVIVNIFAPPTAYRVTLLGERSWTARAAPAPPCSAHAFSRVAPANIFRHRAAHAGCFEKEHCVTLERAFSSSRADISVPYFPTAARRRSSPSPPRPGPAGDVTRTAADTANESRGQTEMAGALLAGGIFTFSGC